MTMTTDRRKFIAQLGAATVAATTTGFALKKPKLKPGLDGHSLRGMKWKSLQLIQYAAEQKLDALLMNGLHYFESREESHLKKVRELADASGIRLYIGAGGISEGAKSFKGQYGTPVETLIEGIRVATLLGAPTVNCRIGNIDDRFTEGSIRARLAEAASALKANKTRAADAGVKFAFENHAGDTRSEEILDLIDDVGVESLGVMLDPGNAVWAMEDPMEQLQKLGDHVICNSVRDYMVWDAPEGATFQWTAIGEGLMDVPAYLKLFREKCQEVPLFVESISNFARPIPFLTQEFMAGFPDLPAAGITGFLKLCRRGHALEIEEPANGQTKKEFDQQHQKSEFKKSIAHLRAQS